MGEQPKLNSDRNKITRYVEQKTKETRPHVFNCNLQGSQNETNGQASEYRSQTEHSRKINRLRRNRQVTSKQLRISYIIYNTLFK